MSEPFITDIPGGASADQILSILRERAVTEPVEAAQDAWELIDRLRIRATHDRDGAAAALNDLFARGTTPTGLNGPTDGMLVATTTNPALDAFATALTKNWMPWRGKSFDAATSTGENRMTDSSTIVGKVLWPLYSMKSGADGKAAFDFETFTEAGKEDPEVPVLVINYESVASNPALLIRSIRDELVELVPGTYLGKIFFRTPALPGKEGNFARIGYFALRTK
ncbi:hypothetical protein SMNI109538_00480 [Smaragdicoccus niigatensis]